MKKSTIKPMKQDNYVINPVYAQQMPNNCPVVEYTADGERVGTCTFYLKDGKTCPRHRIVK